MDLDVRRNPALLKLDLYCKGMRIDDSCLVEQDGGRKVLRTRAGLGSGLEVVLPGGLWTNVPVAERFAQSSPYVLHRKDGSYVLHLRDEEVATLELAPRPAWYDRKTTTGKAMTRIGTLQGTYLGVYPAKVCEYWTEKPQKASCKFCSVGLNLGVDDADEKSIGEVMEVVRAAREESGLTYVDFNTGHYEGDTYLDILEPYIRRIKQETGILVGVQTPPHHDLRRYDALRELGVNRVSFCFEIFDQQLFEEICPGKHREYGLQRYLDAVAYCATLGRKGPRHEPWVTNGEIIAGLEPPESTIRAIDWITSVGAIPTVCVFRPLAGTDYAETAAAADGAARPGVPAALRSVHGEGAADRRRPEHPREPGAAAGRVPQPLRPSLPAAGPPAEADGPRSESDGRPQRARGYAFFSTTLSACSRAALPNTS